MTFKTIILTLYPEMFPSTLGASLPAKAQKSNIWNMDIINIRDFAKDKHKTVDDTSYGGGAGMVMKADIIGAAIDEAKFRQPNSQLIYLTPRGKKLTQNIAENLAKKDGLILLCGRFEAIDERICSYYKPLEISIGDYILFGGEVAALVLLETILRQLSNMLGNAETLAEESFSKNISGLLEYPHYTKPPLWKGLNVPEILTSGNHAEIKKWRISEAKRVTKERRPDLMENNND